MWELDYCSPDAAVLNAWRLRWDVLAAESPALHHDFCHSFIPHPPMCGIQPILFGDFSQISADVPRKYRRVRFAENIDLLLGLDDSLSMTALPISQAAFDVWHDKPWSSCSASERGHFALDAHRCPRDGPLSFKAVLNTGDSHLTSSYSEAVSNSSLDVVDSIDPQFLPACPEAFHSSCRPCAGPLSNEAVLNTRGCISDVQEHTDFPTVRVFRNTDDFHAVPDRVRDHAPPERRVPVGPRGPTPIPGFARDILRNLRVDVLTPDVLPPQGLFVRTWYIHHLTRLISPEFRVVQLGHFHGAWQRDICQVWNDLILPQEDLQLHTILPDPDRSYLLQPTSADVILSQGIDEERFACLVSACHVAQDGHRRSHAVAASMPPRVSGR
eukprot:s2070_g2.t1